MNENLERIPAVWNKGLVVNNLALLHKEFSCFQHTQREVLSSEEAGLVLVAGMEIAQMTDEQISEEAAEVLRRYCTVPFDGVSVVPADVGARVYVLLNTLLERRIADHLRE